MISEHTAIARTLSRLPDIVSAQSLMHDTDARTWRYDALCGRLIELSSADAAASLTATTTLIAQAQREGEPVAWVTTEESCVYPPDLSEQGIDLDALIVVRIGTTTDVPRAAEKLVQSGAFGLIVRDLVERAHIPTPLLARLMQLARKHATVVVCLTVKPSDEESLSSLVSLRGEARRIRREGVIYRFEVHALKNKRGSPWRHTEQCHGPMGLR
ncbi:MAG TPA: recombinase A [Firmicutes bacterium]|nr:recombinase A [Bacillota bacterium]